MRISHTPLSMWPATAPPWVHSLFHAQGRPHSAELIEKSSKKFVRCSFQMSQAKKATPGTSGTKVAVVTTTIYVPKCLDDYFANAVTYGHSDTLFVVTGDTKTPAEAKSFCAEASARHGVKCVFMDVDDQKAYMSKVHTNLAASVSI